MTMVTKSIIKEGMYASGTTVEPAASWRKNQARFKELDQLAKAIKKIT
jgi:UDP-3-O-[3-hydroxymyristoyl] glucosamine N-acyltransferase